MHNDLSLALLHHREGRLDQAAQQYQTILAGNPGPLAAARAQE
jgi:hypothetical protein